MMRQHRRHRRYQRSGLNPQEPPGPLLTTRCTAPCRRPVPGSPAAACGTRPWRERSLLLTPEDLSI
jgi:hypothetical protein